MTTDLKIKDEEVIRIYGKRWDIEVFFKVCKSHLSLAKEYQGRNYDLQIASTSIVFLRYTLLAMEGRQASDERTIGELFFLLSDELEDVKFMHSLQLVLEILRQVLKNVPILSQATVDALLDEFINLLPVNFQNCLLQSA